MKKEDTNQDLLSYWYSLLRAAKNGTITPELGTNLANGLEEAVNEIERLRKLFKK